MAQPFIKNRQHTQNAVRSGQNEVTPGRKTAPTKLATPTRPKDVVYGSSSYGPKFDPTGTTALNSRRFD